ncbi:MAG: hypothetical protein K1X67_16245 [Fimbriimonadaceae bacterium]|nr:hypothetical protein [Fimbriimonadaceae bacterium]
MKRTIYVLIEEDGWSRLVFCPPLEDQGIVRVTYRIADDRRGDFALMDAEGYVEKNGYVVEGPFVLGSQSQRDRSTTPG